MTSRHLEARCHNGTVNVRRSGFVQQAVVIDCSAVQAVDSVTCRFDQFHGVSFQKVAVQTVSAEKILHVSPVDTDAKLVTACQTDIRSDRAGREREDDHEII